MMRRPATIAIQFLAMICVPVSVAAQSNTAIPSVSAPRHLPPRAQGFGTDGESGSYTYDGSGNITAIGADTFLYDEQGRLKSAVIRGVPVTYTYDAFGNRTSASGETNCLGQTVCATPVTVDSATNRLTNSDVTYDAAGNMKTANGGVYAYDGTGMMIQATVGSDDRQFVYTADDERIAVRQGQSWTWTVRGLDNKVLREFTSAEPNNNSIGFPAPGGPWKKDYVWRDGLLLASTDATGTYHYHLDHLGTPRLITDANNVKVAEHAYYPFGTEIALTPHESTEEAMKFTGHERDIVAGDGHTLDDMHARYYNPTIGRFLSVDPVLNAKQAIVNPQGWNRFAYVVNDPLSRIDPDGQVVRLLGTKAERDAAFELITANLRKEDRQYVTMSKNGTISISSKAKGGLGLMMLKEVVRDESTVNVRVGTTFEAKSGPGPSRPQVGDIQSVGGGGITIPAANSMSGNIEVTVDPRGSLASGASASLVMGHELLGHGWDLLFKGKSSERSAVTTETNLLFQLGQPQFRPIPTDHER